VGVKDGEEEEREVEEIGGDGGRGRLSECGNGEGGGEGRGGEGGVVGGGGKRCKGSEKEDDREGRGEGKVGGGEGRKGEGEGRRKGKRGKERSERGGVVRGEWGEEELRLLMWGGRRGRGVQEHIWRRTKQVGRIRRGWGAASPSHKN